MDLLQVLKEFREFLQKSYQALPIWVINGEDQNDSVLDWYQTNWEILVEYRMQSLGLIDGRIDVYGDGADCNGDSSRVFLPEAHPSKSIRINDKYVFHSFGTLKNDYFVQEPPFDFVKGDLPSSYEEIIVKFEEARFSFGVPYDDAV